MRVQPYATEKDEVLAEDNVNMIVDTPNDRSLYAAFDVYPAPKGAATHIKQFANALFEHHGGGTLYVLGGSGLPSYQCEPNVEIIRFDRQISNLLERAMAFGEGLAGVLDLKRESLQVCHYRDPWSGLPIEGLRESRGVKYKTVYEVNALPSIELPYAFPHIAPETLEKIAHQEAYCLAMCDAIVTPSRVTAEMLECRGVAADKISVIPNGAVMSENRLRPNDAPDKYLLYFGAIQQWQGVDELLRAFRGLADFDELKLVMCVGKHNRIAKQYRKLAEKLEIDSRVEWHYGLTQDELVPWVQHAYLTVAPLTDCSRNREQGCCPLKILESMAAGVPVVASDLPVVRELLIPDEHALLVRPGRYLELSVAMRCLLDEPDFARRMGLNAQAHVKQHYTWEKAVEQLKKIYQMVGGSQSH